MNSLRKISLVILMLGVINNASYVTAKPLRINSFDDLPPEVALEIISPSGTLYLISSAEEFIPKGIPFAKARSMAQRVATLRAKATLADYINGSEFEQTIMATDTIKTQGEYGDFTQTSSLENIATMRTTALRGIQLLKVQEDPPSRSIKVFVGLSEDSRRAADTYKKILDDTSTPDRQFYDNKSNVVPQPTTTHSWTDPTF